MKIQLFRYILSFILIFFANITFGQTPFQISIDTWVNHDYLKFSNIGLATYDIENGKFLGGINPKKALTPASSLKIIPTLLTNELLGSDYSFSTKLAYTGSISTDGTLIGNLFIIGSGDPSLGSNRFDGFPDKDSLLNLIVSRVANKGIKCIDGNLYVITNIFDNTNIADTWQWNDLSNYYATGTWGFNYNENKYSLKWNTNQKLGEKVKFITTEPNIPNLIIDIEATVAEKGSGDQSYLIGANNQLNKKLIGTLPKSSKPYNTEGALPNPPLFFAQTLYEKLLSKGYKLCNYQVYDHKLVPKYNVFDSIQSPRLIDLVRETNHKSLNPYCDAFLKILSLSNNQQQGNYVGGINYINEYLLNLGFDENAYKFYDGSGLSSRSYITPEILAKFLLHFTKNYGVAQIQYILPQPGKDGSVRSLLQNSVAKSNFWLKSGSMENIQSYTGICKAKSGKWISFSLIINNFSVSHRMLKNHLEVLLANIYELN